METKRLRYSDLEKQEFIEQWKQSGKNKSAFCKERGLGYFSFCEWIRGKKKIRSSQIKPSFIPVRVKNSGEKLFAQIILKNEIIVNIYQPLGSDLLSALTK